MFPETGSLWKQTPISRALLGISFGVPSKEALPPGSPHRAPTESYAPFPEPFLVVPSVAVPSYWPHGTDFFLRSCWSLLTLILLTLRI